MLSVSFSCTAFKRVNRPLWIDKPNLLGVLGPRGSPFSKLAFAKAIL